MRIRIKQSILHSLIYNLIFFFNKDIRVRLAGRSTSRSGRVEILYNGRWGTVCHDGWGTQEAQ